MTRHASASTPGRFRPPLSFSVETLVGALGEAFAQQGDVLRAAWVPANVFFFRHSDHLKRIFTDVGTGPTKCPFLLPRVKWVMRNGAYILKGGDTWKERRLQVQPAFERGQLLPYANLMPGVMGPMLARWDACTRTGEAFDVRHELETLVVRYNFQFLFSVDLSERDAERIAYLTHDINLHFVKFLPLSLPLPAHRRFRRNWHELRADFLAIIRQRRAEPGAYPDVLSTLIGLRHSQSGDAWSDQDIVDELSSIYFGASVVSTTLSWAVYLLASHEAIQQKLAESVGAVLGGRQPIAEDLPSLPYAQMVLDETLRLYPPSWSYPRFCANGLQLDDYVIPERSVLIPAVYHAHRHPAYWPDPERFDPQRFAPERRQGISAGAYVPFGRGPRTCLGSNLAPLIMQLTLAILVQRYRLSFVASGSNPKIDFGFEIHPTGAIQVRAERI